MNGEIIKQNSNGPCGANILDFHKVSYPTIHTALFRFKSMIFFRFKSMNFDRIWHKTIPLDFRKSDN